MERCRSAVGLALVFVLGVGVAACGEDATEGGWDRTTTVVTSATDVTTASTAADGSSVSTMTSIPPTTRLLEVPGAAPPTVDGTVESAEWEDAAVALMDDDTELHWVHAGGSLYLGIRHDAIGSVNLAVWNDDQVRILHSSAALGSAVYERQDAGSWGLVHDFNWCCRSATDSASREALLTDEGWQASIGFAGTQGEVEYQLVLSEGEVWVAVSVVDSDGTAAFWPTDLPAAARESLYGVRDDRETFADDAWVRLAMVP